MTIVLWSRLGRTKILLVNNFILKVHSYIEINNMSEGLSNFSAQQLSLISLGILV